MRPNQAFLQRVNTIQMSVLALAAIGALVGIIGAVLDTPHFFRIYLVAFLLWGGAAIGCLGLVMLNHLVSGRWSYATQRLAEAGARTMPLLALLFIPIALGLGNIYPWAGESAELLKLKGGKADYLVPSFFVVRAYIYFATWTILAYVLTNWSYKNDELDHMSDQMRHRERNFSAVGIVIYMLTVSLAAVDWTLAITPEFFSSAWGWLELARHAAIALPVLVILLALVWHLTPVSQAVNERVTLDLGAILTASLLAWCYLAGISFIVIWSANIAFNAQWYTPRMTDTWGTYSTILIVLHAIALFALLLPGFKRNRPVLVGLAGFMIVLRVVELYWVVMPNYSTGVDIRWWDLGLIFAIGGLWLAALLWFYGQQAPVPVHHSSLAHSTPAFGDTGGMVDDYA